MIEDFINDCMDSLDSIDTTEIEYDGIDEETSDFYDSLGNDEDIFFDFDTEDITEDGSIYELGDSDLDLEGESESKGHHHKLTKGSLISFTGNGRCRVCGCGAWAGFGNTCENCGHFYDKHI